MTLPDLVVASVDAVCAECASYDPPGAVPGGPLTVDFTVSNQAPSPLASPASKARIYLSTDSVLDGGDRALDLVDVPALGPGANASVSTTITVPADLPLGAYYVLVRANDDGSVLEQTSINNVGATATPVQVGTDLIGLVSGFFICNPIDCEFVTTLLSASEGYLWSNYSAFEGYQVVATTTLSDFSVRLSFLLDEAAVSDAPIAEHRPPAVPLTGGPSAPRAFRFAPRR